MPSSADASGAIFLHLGLILAAVTTAVHAAEPSHSLLADYQRLQEWEFSSTPMSVPAEGLHWRVETGEWHLDRGELRPMRPTSEGQVTGWIFSGAGRFYMEIPDRAELRQLRRFAGEPDLERLEETFDRAVIRAVRFPPLDDLGRAPGVSYSRDDLARDRHEHWLTLRGYDADARVIAALARPTDRYLLVDMHTAARGWLTWELDPQRPEKISVTWFNPRFSILESWVSLDRTAPRAAAVDLTHVDIAADLTAYANESPRGMAKIRPMQARFEARIQLAGVPADDRAIQLYLNARAKVDRVSDSHGQDLPFLRDHLGGRSSAIDRKIYDRSLVVILPSSPATGPRAWLDLAYEMDVDGYLPGRSWYPSTESPAAGLYDRHTARLVLTARDEFALRGMGNLADEGVGDGRRTSVWQVDQPVKMMSFVFAKRAHEETFELDGLPTVTVFSSLGGYLNEERVHEVGVDVVSSLAFFQQLFEEPIPGDRLEAALIPSFHGQAFAGLLHIGDFSVGTDNVAAVELFRAHEVAHEWWGHLVGWAGYRDQWLSEGFAEYSAMMYVEAVVDKGPKHFQEMLAAISDELTGSLASSFSRFSRPGITLLNMRALDRIGPIGHGYRATVGEAPTAYQSQTYKKGAYVLHMLRVILRYKTGSDEAFLILLRAFVDRFADGYPSTADFERVLTELYPADWSWYFDQWVYGAEIPTYLWSQDIESTPDGFVLRLHVEQQNVSPDFRMLVPVETRFSKDRTGTVLAFIDQPVTELEIPLPGKPIKVVFNPDHAILARVKRK